jgi:hypothetical protein
MANYIASDYVSPGYTSLALAAAALETKLETLDSTTQAVWMYKIIYTKEGVYKIILLHKDT